MTSLSRKTFLPFFALASSLVAFEPDENGIYAVFDTSLGEFTAKLAYDGVPLTTANFIGLAQGEIPTFDPESGDVIEQKPFYNGLIFDRVIDSNAIWSGDPEPNDSDINGPGYTIPDEMHPNLSHAIPYVIAMHNDYCFPCEDNGQVWDIGENTGGSRFFITLDSPSDLTSLDGHYSIFGVIADGADTLEAIGDVPVNGQGRPEEAVVINSVTIIREGAAAEAWNHKAYDLPFARNHDVSFLETDTQSGFKISKDGASELLVRKSEDLQTWSNETITALLDENSFFIEASEEAAEFLRIRNVTTPIEYEARIPNATFTAKMANHPLSTQPWVFRFNDNLDDFEDEAGFGVVEIQDDDLPDAKIQSYEYHKLPNGARLRVVTESFQVITYYLRFTDSGKGGLLAWVDDYLHGTGNTPLRFPTTGTFEIAFASE